MNGRLFDFFFRAGRVQKHIAAYGCVGELRGVRVDGITKTAHTGERVRVRCNVSVAREVPAFQERCESQKMDGSPRGWPSRETTVWHSEEGDNGNRERPHRDAIL